MHFFLSQIKKTFFWSGGGGGLELVNLCVCVCVEGGGVSDFFIQRIQM